MSNYLPKGFRDYVFERADALHGAAEQVGSTYAKWGFRRLIPSTMEDADTFALGAGVQLQKQSFRFTDRTGELLALRSDMTLQAARVIGGELNELPPPIRLFYADRSFRNAPDGQGSLRELWQAGAELAGASGPEADAEIIAVSLDAIASLGVKDLLVDIGHAGFVREFLKGISLTQDQAAAVASALERKDERALQDLKNAGTLPEKAWQTAKRLITAFGTGSIQELEDLDLGFAAAAIAELKGIQEVLQTYGVTAKIAFDPGEVRGLDYYTGFFFHIYSAKSRSPLAAGGRYDRLLQVYGRDLPAVGCAIDLAVLVDEVSVRRSTRLHIVNLRNSRSDALALARGLREQGFAVSRDIVRRPWNESLAYAKRMEMDLLVLLESDGSQRVVKVRDGSEQGFSSIESLIQSLKI
jgi:ATP phosphoribosyltransferase regulatory subunit